MNLLNFQAACGYGFAVIVTYLVDPNYGLKVILFTLAGLEVIAILAVRFLTTERAGKPLPLEEFQVANLRNRFSLLTFQRFTGKTAAQGILAITRLNTWI